MPAHSGLCNNAAVTARLPVAPRFRVGFDDDYGRAIAAVGDVDGDGFNDVGVGSPEDDDGGADTGAVWIHYLSATHGRRVSKVSRPFGNLPLAPGSRFGSALAALAALGDLDGNGVIDLAVGAPGTAGGGGVWITQLSRFGGVLSMSFLSPAEAGSGERLVSIGDLDGNGVVDLIADDRIVMLNANGTVRASRIFDRTGVVDTSPGDGFGEAFIDYGQGPNGTRSVLVLGGFAGSFGPLKRIWRVDLDPNGQVAGSFRTNKVLIDATSPGDLDGDGIRDLAVRRRIGSRQDILVELQLLNPDLSARAARGVNAGRGPYSLGDVTGDGVPDVGGTARFAGTGRVFLTRLGGVATADFERRDDADAALMENGRALPPELTGRTFTITTEGAHLGAAAFDSTPLGPNAFGPDADLLVGSGKLLILQNPLSSTQTVPGIFDFPNDDDVGGRLVFEFRRLVRPLSLRVVDVDPEPGQVAFVTLVDSTGRERTYHAPSGFTENGDWRRLDLTTLEPQLGFAAIATATEYPGFDSSQVVRMRILLSGSGAFDDLVFDPYP